MSTTIPTPDDLELLRYWNFSSSVSSRLLFFVYCLLCCFVLSLFFMLQAQGQLERQIYLRPIDSTIIHFVNNLYLVLCVVLRGTWLGMLYTMTESMGCMQPGLHAMLKSLVFLTAATKASLQCKRQ